MPDDSCPFTITLPLRAPGKSGPDPARVDADFTGSIANLLRGPYKPKEYGDVGLPDVAGSCLFTLADGLLRGAEEGATSSHVDVGAIFVAQHIEHALEHGRGQVHPDDAAALIVLLERHTRIVEADPGDGLSLVIPMVLRLMCDAADGDDHASTRWPTGPVLVDESVRGHRISAA